MRSSKTYFLPFSQHRFTVLTKGVTKHEVSTELLRRLSWLRGEQEEWRDTKLQELVGALNEAQTVSSGSLNSWARQYNVAPTNPGWQSHNWSEMFRANCASVLRMAQQEAIIAELSRREGATTSKIQEELKSHYPWLGFTQWNHIDRVRYRTQNRTQNRDGGYRLPSPPVQIPFVACDMHFAKKPTRSGDTLLFSFKSETARGLITLAFPIPKGKRFEGEYTRPTVYVDRKGRLTFRFTVKKSTPAVGEPAATMGVDLGVKLTHVSTVVSRTDGSYTAPILPTRCVNKLSVKIDTLYYEKAKVAAKLALCEERGHAHKAQILYTEKMRLSNKITRLKRERARRVATQLVSVAQQYNAEITFENLKNMPQSQWEHGIVQDATAHKAKIKGVKVRKVSARNTSQHCYKCGAQIKHHARRFIYCPDCRLNLDRDINASRNIAKRGGGHPLTQQTLTYTRTSEPALTPGVEAIHVKVWESQDFP